MDLTINKVAGGILMRVKIPIVEGKKSELNAQKLSKNLTINLIDYGPHDLLTVNSLCPLIAKLCDRNVFN